MMEEEKEDMGNKDVNLLDLSQMNDAVWFQTFEQLDSPLTQCLILIALCETQGII